MNVTPLLTKEYENIRLYRRDENKPNQTQYWLCSVFGAKSKTRRNRPLTGMVRFETTAKLLFASYILVFPCSLNDVGVQISDFNLLQVLGDRLTDTNTNRDTFFQRT